MEKSDVEGFIYDPLPTYTNSRNIPIGETCKHKNATQNKQYVLLTNPPKSEWKCNDCGKIFSL